MLSSIVKRSIVLAGHKTSVSLEDAFWQGLKEIGKGTETTLSNLVASIDQKRLNGNLSSSIRLYVLDHYRNSAAAAVESRASVARNARQFPLANGHGDR